MRLILTFLLSLCFFFVKGSLLAHKAGSKSFSHAPAQRAVQNKDFHNFDLNNDADSFDDDQLIIDQEDDDDDHTTEKKKETTVSSFFYQTLLYRRYLPAQTASGLCTLSCLLFSDKCILQRTLRL